MDENVNGPGQGPGRERFSLNKGSVAPALWLAARLLLQAAMAAVIRKVIDQVIP